jgi:hypothetical protein
MANAKYGGMALNNSMTNNNMMNGTNNRGMPSNTMPLVNNSGGNAISGMANRIQ